MIRLLSFALLIAFLAFMLSPKLRAWLRARAVVISLGAVAVVGIALAVTGRLHWVVAAIGAALPMVWRLAGLLRFLPMLRGVFNRQAQAKPTASSGPMSRDEAAEMLGVDPNADRDTVLSAHRRLIQKLHPDRGGTDYLAARLNEARDCLLKER